MTRDEIVALIVSVARESGIDPAEFLGGAIAESALNPTARRPRDPAQDAASWPDVSFGLFQQTARFADEGDQSPRPDNIRYIEELYSNPWHASRVAARKYKMWRKIEATALDAWCRYNWPTKPPAENPNRANYARSLDEAKRLLSSTGGPAPSLPPAPATPTNPPGAMKLSDVLARARTRTGDPYVWGGKTPGGFDCSGFIAWAYEGKVPSFTDAILDATERTATPAPGDIVLWEYRDPSQPGVRFPHVGLYLDDATTLDARFGKGVGEHPQIPRAQATRYYRRVPGVVVDTAGDGPPVPAPGASDQMAARIRGLEVAVAHLADVVVPNAATGAAMREQALAEAQKIREQFLGAKA